MFQKLQSKINCAWGVCKGCQVGLKNQKNELLGKGWKFLGTAKGLIRHMNLKCSGDHVHGACEARNCHETAFYTPDFLGELLGF